MLSNKGQSALAIALILLILLAVVVLVVFGTDGLKNLMELSKSLR